MKFTKPFFLLITSLSFLFTFSSCDFPEHYWTSKPVCQNSIDYFNTADAASPAYQTKAINILRDHKPTDFRYFFKTFLEGSPKVYMLVNFRNKEHCFDVKVLVDNWKKLGGMRRTNGKAYPKELYDLEWSIITVDGKQEVYYIDMHDIID